MAYEHEIHSLAPSDYASAEVRSALPVVSQLASGLLDALEHTLQGRPADARGSLDAALALVNAQLKTLMSVDIPTDKLGALYRIRLGSAGASFKRPDLFHIPYQLRHLVAPKRFSVLGLPMLYLGNTLYVCWEELDRPDFGQMWVAALRLKKGKTVRVLNLAYRPGFVANLLEQAAYPVGNTAVARIAVAYAIVWPLIAASTFPAQHRNSPFVIEYVIPQLLAAWLSESKDFIGVRYFSTHVVKPHSASMAAFNFVFPARGLAQRGFSKQLTSLFAMTTPVHWPFMRAAGPVPRPRFHGRVTAVLSAGDGIAVEYAKTEFADLESCLDQMIFASIR